MADGLFHFSDIFRLHSLPGTMKSKEIVLIGDYAKLISKIEVFHGPVIFTILCRFAIPKENDLIRAWRFRVKPQNKNAKTEPKNCSVWHFSTHFDVFATHERQVSKMNVVIF